MKKLAWLLVALAPLAFGQPKKIVVVGLAPAEIEALRQAAPGARIVPGIPAAAHAVTAVTPDSPEAVEQKEKLLKEVADADAFIGGPTAEVIRAGRKLQWVQVLSAGVEPYRYPELIDSGITLTNARLVASPGIADHAMGMLLALTRKLTYFASIRPDEVWERKPYDLVELQGKTAVIVGMGGIGSHIAKRAKAFDMKVIGVDPKELPPSPAVDRMTYPDRLDEVVPLADAVFLAAPHTPESEGMFGARQFELMKKGSYFIAVSRGKLYSLEALVKALDSRRLAGAGVDVTDPEPLPKRHPLWKFDNVVITPHIATQSDGEFPRRLELLKENVARFVKGEQLHNVVDKKKGY
ncbi:MAG: D-2-hydroxyacid dehydrogenase [Bryobacteraceae bacterium]|nr:D-2-hydroxyacid dehydrogenase [Bryobacteraceae bacterium]